MTTDPARLMLAGFALLAAIYMGWYLQNGWRRGVLSSKGWRARRADNPSGFYALAAFQGILFLGVLAIGVWVLLG